MMFLLKKDKVRLYSEFDTPFVEAGAYPIIRWFDEERLIVDLNFRKRDIRYKLPRQITILRLEDGKIVSDNNFEKQVDSEFDHDNR